MPYTIDTEVRFLGGTQERVNQERRRRMAYIVDGELPKGDGYYVDLWADVDDPNTAFEFHAVNTEEERDKLIEALQEQGHESCPSFYGG